MNAVSNRNIKVSNSHGIGAMSKIFVWTFKSLDEIVLTATEMIEGGTSPTFLSSSTPMGWTHESMDLWTFALLFEARLSTTRVWRATSLAARFPCPDQTHIKVLRPVLTKIDNKQKKQLKNLQDQPFLHALPLHNCHKNLHTYEDTW